MELVKVSLKELRPYPNNPRKNDGAVEAVAESIRQCGYVAPIIVDEDMEILAGHTRFKALKKLGRTEAEVIIRAGLTEEQKKKYRLLDNKTNEFADWDDDLLAFELEDLDFDGFDFGFPIGGETPASSSQSVSLAERFGAPPFSVLDTRQGYWQERKAQWKELGIKSEVGRMENLMNASDLPDYADNGTKGIAPQTSIFDPVLCEIAYKWFCPSGGKIFDCFAGGSVRGIVAAKLGYDYLGIDLRREQVEANRNNAEEIGVSPTWHCDDSLNADKYLEDASCDLIFSCPPYADLEVYSDDPRDISNMEYDDFCDVYEKIISIACRKLKKDRFAVFVVGDIRDKKGFYRNFVDLTKKCFNKNGAETYNELILVEQFGTAGLRAGRTFGSMRKVIKTHQNVLVFYKGNPQNIKKNFDEIELGDWEKEYDEQSNASL